MLIDFRSALPYGYPAPEVSFMNFFWLLKLYCFTKSNFGLQLPHASSVFQRTECADTTKQDAVSCWTCWGSGVKFSTSGRWRSYDRTNSLRTPTMKESQLLREKMLPRSLFQHVQTLCMPSFIDLHTHATAGHGTLFACT